MQQVAVVIPVYKAELDNDEAVSLRQTFRVLRSYPMILVCPNGLDISEYDRLAVSENAELLVEGFESRFFEGISGYNRMLLTEGFYQRFSGFEYILICQPDAYVFRDELGQWCARGYDFIGAPLFGRFEDTEFHYDMSRVGNGGLSLRKTKTFLDFFKGRKLVFKTGDVANRICFRRKPYTRWLVWVLMALGWRNTPKAVARRWKYNEDDFWSGLLDGSNYELRKPKVDEALGFAFERFPSECFEITGKLPFGCHAWRKYQYEEFWCRSIRISE